MFVKNKLENKANVKRSLNKIMFPTTMINFNNINLNIFLECIQ